MNVIWIAISSMAEIMLLLALGFVMRKARFLSDAVQAGCMEFMMKIAVPAQIVAAAASITLSADLVRDSLLILLISLLGYVIAGAMGFGASRVLRLSVDERTAAVGTMMFKNIMFIGLPLSSALLGPESTFYAMSPVIISNIVMFSFGVSLYSQGRAKGFSAIIKNPAMICCVAMLLLIAFQVRLPDVVQSVLLRLRSASTPVSLVVIGMMLADGNLSLILKSRTPWVVSVLSLVVYPLIILCLVLLLKPGKEAAAVMMTFAVLPAGTLNAIVAKQYGTSGELTSLNVLHTMIISIAVLAFGLPMLLVAIGYWG